MRLFLEFQGGSVQIPPGETIVGRHVSCSLRFNDPYISREHVRIVVGKDHATVEELVTRNGTLLNGVQVQGCVRLSNGDTLRLGKRSLQILLAGDDPIGDGGEATRPDYPELSSGLMGIEAAMNALAERPETLPAPPAERTCPTCRSRVLAVADRCESCGHQFPVGRPGSTTQKIHLADLEAHIATLDRRGDVRTPLEVPVVYTSEALTIDATTNDLSRTGVFIRSALLDEVGTRCHVTLLPEAAPAIPIESVVARVVGGTPESSGMGIRFTTVSDRARYWLETILDRDERASRP